MIASSRCSIGHFVQNRCACAGELGRQRCAGYIDVATRADQRPNRCRFNGTSIHRCLLCKVLETTIDVDTDIRAVDLEPLPPDLQLLSYAMPYDKVAFVELCDVEQLVKARWASADRVTARMNGTLHAKRHECRSSTFSRHADAH